MTRGPSVRRVEERQGGRERCLVHEYILQRKRQVHLTWPLMAPRPSVVKARTVRQDEPLGETKVETIEEGRWERRQDIDAFGQDESTNPPSEERVLNAPVEVH